MQTADTTSRLRGFAVIAALCGSVGCTDPSHETQTRIQPLTTHAPTTLDVSGQDQERLIITARVEQVPLHTDAPRTLIIEQVPSDFRRLRGERVLDARLVEDGVLFLGVDHVLRLAAANDTRDLADEVLGPISAVAGRVAYVRGTPPDLQLEVIDLADGTRRALAPELAPVWSPALSPDGRDVVFAASQGGRPQLFIARESGQITPLPLLPYVPSSPNPPIWRDGRLFFEHEGGVVQLNLTTFALEQEFVGATLLPDDESGAIRVSIEGGEQLIAAGGAR